MRRIGSSARAASAAFCLAISLAACVPGTIPPRPRQPAEVSETPSAPDSESPLGTASASPLGTGVPAQPSEAPTAEWTTFTTSNDQFMFDHPPDWSVRDRALEAAPGGIFVEVLNAAGKSMASLRTNIAVTADCAEKHAYSLMDSEELPALAQGGVAPRFVFEGRAGSGEEPDERHPLAYGITSAAAPSGPTACPISHFFTWPPSVAMFGGTYNPLDTSAGNAPNVDTPATYTETAEYDDVRAMITSLRPAEH
jgi:hypothetical protein